LSPDDPLAVVDSGNLAEKRAPQPGFAARFASRFDHGRLKKSGPAKP
jgi:hypothetical protein